MADHRSDQTEQLGELAGLEALAAQLDPPRRRRPSAKAVAGVLAVVLTALIIGGTSYLVGIITAQNGALATALTQSQQGKRTPTPEQIRKNPDVVQSPQPGPSGPAGANASDAQVRAAVAAYFAAHPVRNGANASPVDIAAAVANYLTAHPAPAGAQGVVGATGPGPTADQVADAVATYLVAHPPERGPVGEQGPAGPAPTGEQLANAVRDYLTEHPLPTCPAGSTATPVTVATVENGLPTGQARIIACQVDNP